MVRITCPTCGAVTNNRSQKFCTQCGTRLPVPPPAFITSKAAAGIVIAAGIVVVIAIFAVFLFFPVQDAGRGPAEESLISGIPVSTSVPATIASQTPATPLMTTTPAPVSPTPNPTTKITATPRKTTQTPVTTVPTAPLTPVFTAQITLSVTRIPVQPPADTYASKTEGAPFIDPFSLEARIHALINEQRQQNGLSTLSYDSFLASIARGHSYDMSLRHFFEHTNPDGMDARARGDWAGYPCVREYDTYYTEGISENLAMVYRYDTYRDLIAPNGTIMQTEYQWSTEGYIANKVVNGWMNSEGHRNNILDYHFQQEGIGVAFAPDNAIYITENFC
ncbi:MAG TPA: CAP domain-containing protein [Methanoregula sp.]|nr:CAP domain-containing protein [Methanoregula sp.]